MVRRVLFGQAGALALVLGALGLGVVLPAAAVSFTTIDLNPKGFTGSEAEGVSGGQQVGWGSGPATGGFNHALLWAGSATSVVDLNPSGFTVSLARGVSGGQQVGNGGGPATGGSNHALLWAGSAASMVDLSQFLPAGFTESQALGIDADGNIVGVASGPVTGGVTHAFLWQPVPEVAEPGSLTLIFIGVVGPAGGWLRRKTHVGPLHGSSSKIVSPGCL